VETASKVTQFELASRQKLKSRIWKQDLKAFIFQRTYTVKSVKICRNSNSGVVFMQKTLSFYNMKTTFNCCKCYIFIMSWQHFDVSGSMDVNK